MSNKTGLAATATLSFIFTCCLLGPLLLPFDASRADFSAIDMPPSFASGHLFGTDDLGRDLLMRVLVGGRISLATGILATLVAVVVGSIYGSVAGFFGGVVDQILMRGVDVLYGVPFVFFVIMLELLMGRGLVEIFTAIGLLTWPVIALIARAQTLSLVQREFVVAARATGTRPLAIVARHIIPNAIGPVIAFASLLVPEVIIGESFLSYLGLGVQEPQTSWGTLISAGTESLDSYPWQIEYPAAALALTLCCLNLAATSLRDRLNPRKP